MIALDTLKLKIHDSQTDIRPEHRAHLFPKRIKVRGKYEPGKAFPPKYLPPGFNSLELQGHWVIVSLSAKILGPRYPELINPQTFPLVVEALSQFLTFYVSTEELVRDSEVLLCHVCQNLPVSQPLPGYLLHLAALTPPDFHSTYYFHRKEVRFNEIKNLKTKDFETIAFQNGCISGSSKRRLVFYSKIHELLRRRNSRYAKSLADFNAVRDAFAHSLRVELPLENFDALRDSFKIPADLNPKLSDIIYSNENPVADLFDILRSSSTSPAPPQPPILSLAKTEKTAGVDSIVRSLNLDGSLINAFLRENWPSSAGDALSRYLTRAEELRREELKLATGESVSLLDELSNVMRGIPSSSPILAKSSSSAGITSPTPDLKKVVVPTLPSRVHSEYL